MDPANRRAPRAEQGEEGVALEVGRALGEAHARLLAAALHAPDGELEEALERHRARALEPHLGAGVAVRAAQGAAREVDGVHGACGARHGHARQQRAVVRTAWPGGLNASGSSVRSVPVKR